MSIKTLTNHLNPGNISGWFDDDENTSFFSRIKVFRQVKRQESKKKQAIITDTTKAKDMEQSHLKQIPSIQASRLFSNHFHIIRHPLHLMPSSFFHVPFSLAIEHSIISSAIMYIIPLENDYLLNRFTYLKQPDESVLFSSKMSIGMFVLIEGALVKYDLYESDMRKPEHVIMIHHNTSVRVLNHFSNSKQILEIANPPNSSNEMMKNAKISLNTCSTKNITNSLIPIKNDKQLEVILLSMTIQESLNDWIKALNYEISRRKRNLMLNNFNNNTNTQSISSNQFSIKVNKEMPITRLQSYFHNNYDNRLIKQNEDTKIQSYHQNVSDISKNNTKNKYFSEKADGDIVDPFKMCNLSVEQSKKDQNTLLAKDNSILSYLASSNSSSFLKRSLSQFSGPKNLRVSSYASSLSSINY